ncbi:MAG TPA: pyridine nucleotide-disulfide oxidoreductase [Spirochaetales bacterium]|nr:pyridine nucleotide-disulfide oxidoreductase [Spirochaetales bacterium]HPM72817.1 pyridine nucleotide-disulfide oxidoreductase [Spirochaetales bacterium]
MEHYDVAIIGTGPAGLGAAFSLLEARPGLRLALVDRNQYSSGGLRNDCKMNFSWPVGFPEDDWDRAGAERYLERVEAFLSPEIMGRYDVDVYARRAERLGCSLLEIRQAHLGTDGGLALIKRLVADLERRGAAPSLDETVLSVDAASRVIVTDRRELSFRAVLVAPGRAGFAFLQDVMRANGVPFVDNVVDVGVRVELREDRYPIVKDYYDPKFLFPKKVRTFCTNSRAAHVVQERYEDEAGAWYSVNGHAWSKDRPANGLANFAMLKTIALTEPLASGQAYARALGAQAMLLGGGRPIMQRVGDFRLGRRSTREAFTGDLYDFAPTLPSCTPGDLGLAVPAKVMRALWNALKSLDTIVPGVLHPSTVLYYPEIKTYANKPVFQDPASFRAAPGLYLAGDGAGTSRGITAAWASGMRVADGMLGELGER